MKSFSKSVSIGFLSLGLVYALSTMAYGVLWTMNVAEQRSATESEFVLDSTELILNNEVLSGNLLLKLQGGNRNVK